MVVCLLPFYLLIRANAAWTPFPRFFPDDAFYARMCLPSGLLLYWHDYGLYRILAVPAFALLTRTLMRASLSPASLTLSVMALATGVFVWASVSAGLSKRRGALLAGVLLGSPLLLETLNFWAGMLNYALALLLLAGQLRASLWARRFARPKRGFIVTACSAALALLAYEIALPFILATSALYVRGHARRIMTVCLAGVALIMFVAALAAAGLYWPARFKLLADQMTSAASAAPTLNALAPAPNAPVPATPANAPARARMYASLLFSFILTGCQSWRFWGLVAGLAGMSFLSRPADAAVSDEAAEEKRMPAQVLAAGFAFACLACLVYLLVAGTMNARYIAFLLIYGVAALAWTKGRVAYSALAAILIVQGAVAASLPVHLRDVESAAKSQVSFAATGEGDVIVVEGRLSRGSWEKRYVAPAPIDIWKQPLSPRACRYSEPCEQCPSPPQPAR